MQPTYIIQTVAFLLPIFLASWVLRPRLEECGDEIKLFVGWVLATLVGFTLLPGLGLFLLFALILVACAPRKRVNLACYLIGMILVLPDGIQWQVPFPGVNYLFTMSPLFVVVVVGSLLVNFREKPVWKLSGGVGNLSRLVGLFFVLRLLLDLRNPSTFTNELRDIFTGSIETLGLYFLLAGLLTGPASERTFRSMFLLSLVLISGPAALVLLKGWDVYGAIDNLEFGYIARSGSLRAGAQFFETMLGTLMVVFGYTLFFYRKSIQPRVVLLGWLLMAIIGVKVSGTRGAILVAMVIGTAHFILATKDGSRQFMLASIAGLAALAGFIFLTQIGLDTVDPYGTFSYRQKLYEMSWSKFLGSPILGDASFSSDPFFEPLRQGQGIIDFTSVFVVTALGMGSVGLILFVSIFGNAIIRTMKLANQLGKRGSERDIEMWRYGRWLTAIIAGYFVMMGTVSGITNIYEFFFILVAVAQAYIVQAEKMLAGQTQHLNEAYPSPLLKPFGAPSNST
jgi:hypothetical protein